MHAGTRASQGGGDPKMGNQGVYVGSQEAR